MRKLNLNLCIYEEAGKWHVNAEIPNVVNTNMHIVADSREQLLDMFADTMKDNNIRYWYMMSND